MDQNAIKDVISMAISQIAYPLIYVSIAAFVFLALQGFVKDILLYLSARFDEVGCGVVLKIDKDLYRLQKIRFGYIQLIDLETKTIILRITLRNWKNMNKYMYFNGTPKRRADDKLD